MATKIRLRLYMADSADIENPTPRAELGIRDGVEVDRPFKSIADRNIHTRAIRDLVEGLQAGGIPLDFEIVDDEEIKAARRNATPKPSLSARS